MRYLPKNAKDTYNYANPTIKDKLVKKLKKIFTLESILKTIAILIFLSIMVFLYIVVFTALLPFYFAFYAIVVMLILSIVA